MTARTRERGPRRMPSMAAVAAAAGLREGECLRCGANARCERAHVIDRCFDGLDGVQNVVPLCFQCHSEMPPFIPGEERKAWLWLRTTSETEYFVELVARCLPFLPLAIDEIKVATDEELRIALAGAIEASGFASARNDRPKAAAPTLTFTAPSDSTTEGEDRDQRTP